METENYIEKEKMDMGFRKAIHVIGPDTDDCLLQIHGAETVLGFSASISD